MSVKFHNSDEVPDHILEETYDLSRKLFELLAEQYISSDPSLFFNAMAMTMQFLIGDMAKNDLSYSITMINAFRDNMLSHAIGNHQANKIQGIGD